MSNSNRRPSEDNAPHKLKNRRGGKTVGDPMREGEAAPKYAAMRIQQDEEFRVRAEQLDIARAPIESDLRIAGLVDHSFFDIYRTAESLAAAQHILLSHFELPYPPNIRAIVGGALRAGPTGGTDWHLLLGLYRNEQEPFVKEALAGAIWYSCRGGMVDDVVTLVRDKNNGGSRVILLPCLMRSRKPHARAALEEARHDPELSVEANYLLRPRRKRGAKGSVRDGSTGSQNEAE